PHKHSRRVEIAGAGGDLTASENACSSLYRVEHLAMEVLAGTGGGQWAELDAFLHGIAHWKRLGLFDKRLGEVVKQRLRYQEPLGANATLAVVEVARRHGELHGFRKIGVLQNDEWIGPAEFQHRSLAGLPRFRRNGAAGADAAGDGGGPHPRIGDDGRTRLNLDCKVHIKSFGATGVAHQGLQRFGAALHCFGMLDERGIADKGGGVEEAQHLPEGYVPRLNGEDWPYRVIDYLRRYACDGLWLEISLPRFGEVAGGPSGFLDLENGVRQWLAHLGGDQAAIGLGPLFQQLGEPSEEGDSLVQWGAGPVPPAVPRALQARVGLCLIVLPIDAKKFTRRRIP